MLWSPNSQLHYPFENTAKDYSGNGRDGTVNGSGVYATRPGGSRSLYFDGNGDYVVTPSLALSGTVFILSSAIRCKINTAAAQMIWKDGSYAATAFCYIFREANTSDLAFRCNDGATHTIYTATNFFSGSFEDAWLSMMIVADFVGKLVRFYRNGTLFFTSAAMSGTPVFPSFNRAKYLGTYDFVALMLKLGYLQNLQVFTLATMPAAAQMLANAKRLMLGFNPIW